MRAWLTREGSSYTLAVRVQPRASRDEVVGLHGGRLRLRITAPPVDGAANEHLTRFVAAQFGVAPRQVTLLGGRSGRDKLLRIDGAAALPAAIARLAGDPGEGGG